jgi:hypothetical protein
VYKQKILYRPIVSSGTEKLYAQGNIYAMKEALQLVQLSIHQKMAVSAIFLSETIKPTSG